MREDGRRNELLRPILQCGAVVGTSGSKCLNGNFLRRHHHLCLIHHLAEQSTARKLWPERLMHLSRKLIGGGLQHQSTYLCRLLFASFLNVRNVSVISSRFTAGGNVKFFPWWLRRRLGEIGVICGSGVGPTGDSTLLVGKLTCYLVHTAVHVGPLR